MTKTADERAIVCYLELDRANFLLMFAGVDGAVGIIEEHLIEYGKQEREAALQVLKKKVTALTISNPDDMYNTALCDVVVTIEALLDEGAE